MATLVIGPQVKPHYESSVRYDHANLLSTVCAAMALTRCPWAGTVALPMSDFFNGLNIATPFPDAAVASPVHIQASAPNDSPVTAMQIYVDNVLKYQAASDTIDASLPMSAGNHLVVVQSWDSAGGIHKRSINVNVQSQAVVVTNPAPNSIVGSSVQVGAVAGGQNTVSKMQLYVDGAAQYQATGNTLTKSVSLSSGKHTILIEAADNSGNIASNNFSVTSTGPRVRILSPAPDTSSYSPMFVSALAVDPTPVTAIQVYVDSNLVYEVSGTGIQDSIFLPLGQHSVTVQEWNKAGATYKRTIDVNIIGVPITISSPMPNATVTSPVTITASAPSTSAVQTMQIYIDDVMLYQVSGKSVSHSFTLSPGQHKLVAKGWDSSGGQWYTVENIIVN